MNSQNTPSCQRKWLVSIFALHLLVLGFVSGCGSNKIDGSTVASAQLAYDTALSAFNEANYGAARASFDQALAGTSALDPDQYVDALLKRSICLSIAGEFDAATADIANAEQGATDLSQVHVAKGILLSKQGDEAGAKTEFANAKRVDPKVVIPKV